MILQNLQKHFYTGDINKAAYILEKAKIHPGHFKSFISGYLTSKIPFNIEYEAKRFVVDKLRTLMTAYSLYNPRNLDAVTLGDGIIALAPKSSLERKLWDRNLRITFNVAFLEGQNIQGRKNFLTIYTACELLNYCPSSDWIISPYIHPTGNVYLDEDINRFLDLYDLGNFAGTDKVISLRQLITGGYVTDKGKEATGTIKKSENINWFILDSIPKGHYLQLWNPQLKCFQYLEIDEKVWDCIKINPIKFAYIAKNM